MLIGNNRYRLIETVGQGGMGRVWRARDEVLGREVAVKQLLISAHLDDTTRRTLIQRAMGEARAAARLKHPGIVTVHDIVEHDDAPWIVMEFISGPSLGALIAAGDRPGWRNVAALGAHVAEALAHAHAAGVVHRDLKPDNILLLGDRPVITDFGIARLLDATTQLTSTHTVLGTPQYMSPEQLQGQQVTSACDLWALGATLFAVMEGKVPFDGPTLMSIITAVLTQPLPQPQNAGPLTDLLTALLEKDPQRRPDAETTAARLWQTLQAVDGPTERETSFETVTDQERKSQQTTTSAPLPPAEPEPRNKLRRRTLILGGAGLAVAAAGGTTAALLIEGDHAPATPAFTGTLPGYTGYIYSIAFSPDGKTLVAGCDDKNVRLWNVATGTLVATFVGHTKTVYAVAFSPDGKTVASGSADTTVRLWAVSTHTAVTTLVANASVMSVAFSPDGKTLATSGDAGMVLLWDLSTYGNTDVFGSNLGGWAVAYSPDGKVLADGGLANKVVLWNTANSKQIGTLTVDSELGTYQVAFSPDSKILATANFPVNAGKGNDSSTVQLFDVATLATLATLSASTLPVMSVAFSPDGATLASASDDQTVRLWDVASKRTRRTISGIAGGARSVAFSPDGTLIAVGSKTAQLWTA